MGDNNDNTRATTGTTDYSTDARAPTQNLRSEDPPPNYSSCIGNSAGVHSKNPVAEMKNTAPFSYPTNMYHPPVNHLPEDNASESHPLNGVHQHAPVTGHVVHDTASSAPFLDPNLSETENPSYGWNPRTNAYNPQPAYNPGYSPSNTSNPPPIVHGRKTIILQRTDAEIHARRKKMIIATILGLLIGTLIPIIMTACILKWAPKRHKIDYLKKSTTEAPNYYSNLYNHGAYDDSPGPPINPYLTDSYKNNLYDRPWRTSTTTTTTTYRTPNMFDDLELPKVYEPKKPSETYEDDILRKLGIDTEFLNRYKEIGRQNEEDPPHVIKPFEVNDELKEILGIRDRKSADDKTKTSLWN